MVLSFANEIISFNDGDGLNGGLFRAAQFLPA